MSLRLVRFLAVGAVGAVVNLGSLALLVAAGLDKYLASPVAIEAAILSNFALHRVWTFADRRGAEGLLRQGLRFKSVALLALAASYATFVLLSLTIPAIPLVIAQAIAILPGTAVNYLLNDRWTFCMETGAEVGTGP